MELIELTGSDVLLQKGAFLASETSVDVSSAAQMSASKALFSGAGLFVLRASGSGTLAINAHGGLMKYELASGETRAVDNGHLVAWDTSMDYELRVASRHSTFLGSIVRSAASGEGIMCFFRGPGRLWLQTHKPQDDSNRGTSSRNGRNSSCRSGGNSVLVMFLLFFFLLALGIALAVVSQSGTVIRDSRTASSSFQSRPRPREAPRVEERAVGRERQDRSREL